MSRSLHPTLKRFGEVGNTPHKRFLKRAVREERRRRELAAQVGAVSPSASAPPAPAAGRIPLVVGETPPGAAFPASADDVRAVLARLPPETLEGLARVEFTVPHVQRHTRADGVLAGAVLGQYTPKDAVIQLFGFWYDEARPDRAILAMYLRLEMLATLVHEVAHHVDFLAHVGRGRWVRTSRDEREGFAEAAEYAWTREHVIPYLEETHAAGVAALRAWLREHGGAAVDLAQLAGDSRRQGGESLEQQMYTVRHAFFSLLDGVAKGEPRAETQTMFALHLHYHHDYEAALEALACALAAAPDHRTARYLVADIYMHQGRFEESMRAARELLRDQPDHMGAWKVLAEAAQGQGDWAGLVEATDWLARLETRAAVWRRHDALTGLHARIELGEFAAVERDLAALSFGDTASARGELLGLRAHLRIRRGDHEGVLGAVHEWLAGAHGEMPALAAAARFEAAHRLGRPAEAGRLTVDDRSWLGSHGLADWLAQLDALAP
jgi:tetratricopeptide (TPR) repeat protein